jgi:glucose-6-phosphate 1-epimerase
MIQDAIRPAEFPSGVTLLPGNGGLPKLQIRCPQVDGEIYLHGAHITSWKPAGAREVIWVSEKSTWESGKPIRGGVPICFPWFGPKKDDPSAPAHGFARLREWRLDAVTAEQDAIAVALSLNSDNSTKQWWPFDFTARMRVAFGSQLIMSLEVENTGNTPFSFEEALHTYFAVADVRQIELTALDGLNYLDKTDGFAEKSQQGAVRISAETDRVYLNALKPVEIHDPLLRRRIRVTKQNSNQTVVWNPWAAKAKSMPDFGDDEWTGMVCVEACNALSSSVQLAPGERHTMTAVIEQRQDGTLG